MARNGFRKTVHGQRGEVTLRTVLLTFTGSLLLLVLFSTVSIGFDRFRGYIADQQQGHAQDGATALGMSLSNAIDGRDPVASASVVDAVFDSGRYLSVKYLDTTGKVIAGREDSLSDIDVPGWFISLVHLPVSVGEAEVMRGWSRLGTVEVVSHPGQAYRDLWTVTVGVGAGVCLVALLGLALLFWIITRALLPLRAVEGQARALGRRDFRRRVTTRSTRELNQVTHALNQMADDLSRLFEGQAKLIQHLRKINNEDQLTGLASRSAFEQRLKVEVESEERAAPGLLMLFQLSGFSQFNQVFGREEADQLLAAVADVIREFAEHHADAFAGRRSGAEIAIFLPGISRADGLIWGQELIDKIGSVCSQKTGESLNMQVHAGIAEAEDSHLVRDLWAAVDEALRQAQTEAVSCCHLSDPDRLDHRNTDQWRSLISEAIARKQLSLWMQPMNEPGSKTAAFYQVFSRIESVDGHVKAGIFVPMAERFGLIPAVDDQMISMTLDRLRQYPDEYLSMTLGKLSVADPAFRTRMVETLEASGADRHRLMIGISEHTLSLHHAEVAELVAALNRLEVPVIVDRFGVGGVPFSYLRNLRFQAVRIDHSFVHDIDVHGDNRFYIESVMSIAHSTGVKVYVSGVETAKEYDVLTEIGVDGVMGYHLARPFKADR